MTFTHTRPQVLQTAELKLLHGSFSAPEFLRNFADTLLLREAHQDDPALIDGKLVDKAEEPRAVFDLLETNLRRIVEVLVERP